MIFEAPKWYSSWSCQQLTGECPFYTSVQKFQFSSLFGTTLQKWVVNLGFRFSILYFDLSCPSCGSDYLLVAPWLKMAMAPKRSLRVVGASTASTCLAWQARLRGVVPKLLLERIFIPPTTTDQNKKRRRKFRSHERSWKYVVLGLTSITFINLVPSSEVMILRRNDALTPRFALSTEHLQPAALLTLRFALFLTISAMMLLQFCLRSRFPPWFLATHGFAILGEKNHKFPGICQSGWDWHICGFLAKTCNLRPKKHGKTHILSTPKQTARPYPSCFQQPKMELPIPKGSLHEAPRRVINSFASCGRIGALT